MTGVSLPISCLFCSRSGQRPPKRRPAFEPLVTDIKGESARGSRPQNMVAFLLYRKEKPRASSLSFLLPPARACRKSRPEGTPKRPTSPLFLSPPAAPCRPPMHRAISLHFSGIFRKAVELFLFLCYYFGKISKIFLCSARRQGACAVRPLFQKRAAWQRPPRGLLSAALRKEGIFCPAFCLTPCLSYSCSAWALRPILP